MARPWVSVPPAPPIQIFLILFLFLVLNRVSFQIDYEDEGTGADDFPHSTVSANVYWLADAGLNRIDFTFTGCQSSATACNARIALPAAGISSVPSFMRRKRP